MTSCHFTPMPTVSLIISFFFFFNDTATTEIYTLSLHDALPIYVGPPPVGRARHRDATRPSTRSTIAAATSMEVAYCRDRKSTRLNSSHGYISYAVFCLKKKKNKARAQL